MRRLLILTSLIGCFLIPGSAAARLKVITTFTVIEDMARNVAGEAAEVVCITKPGAEIHDYQPTPKDIAKARSANLILWNGMNLERWFEKFYTGLKGIPAVTLTEGIVPLSIYEGPYKDKPNPHAWMSAKNALIYVENIRKAFVEHDPANATIYNNNAKAYSEKIKSIDKFVRGRIAGIPEDKRWLATSEGAFSYLAKDYDLKEIYIWPINADQQGTPRQVKAVIDRMRANGIRVIFSESTVSDKPARQVAREAGAKYGGILYVDSLSAEGGPVPTYLDLLKTTSETIIKGLSE